MISLLKVSRNERCYVTYSENNFMQRPTSIENNLLKSQSDLVTYASMFWVRGAVVIGAKQ